MRHMWRLTLGDERGAIFLSGLVLVMVMTILGVSLFSLSRIEGGLATSDVVSSRLLYCAEAGLGRTLNDLSAGGRVDQIFAAALTPGLGVTFTEALPDPLNSGRVMCSNTIVFSDVANAACTGGRCRYLTATSVGSGGIQRSVRVQLSSSWQNWTSVNQNGTPFWDGDSSDFATAGNIGNWLSNTVAFSGGSGPGARYPFLGNTYNSGSDTGGTPLPDIFFSGNGGTVTVTFEAEFTAYDGHHGPPPDKFGWFEYNPVTGTIVNTTLLFNAQNYTANTQLGLITGPAAVSVNFTPSGTKKYGFYLTNATNETMYSVSTKQAAGNTAQHFAFFRQNANTYWMGVEDLNSSPDRDFQDMIFKLVVANGDQVVVPGSSVSPLTWKEWQECPPCS